MDDDETTRGADEPDPHERSDAKPGIKKPGIDRERSSEDALERYEHVSAEDVVDDAVKYFATDEDEPAATDIPADGPPPPNA